MEQTQKPPESIYERIRADILNNVLLPEQRIPEEALAQQYSVSRTPVREALRQLEAEGFVTTIRNVGAFVRRVSLKEVTDLFDVRSVLEGLSARLAALRQSDDAIRSLEILRDGIMSACASRDMEAANRMDNVFHRVIAETANNMYILKLTSTLQDRMWCYLNISSISRVEYLSGLVRDRVYYNHDKLLEAIKRGDAEQAETHARRHVESAKKYFVEFCYQRGI